MVHEIAKLLLEQAETSADRPGRDSDRYPISAWPSTKSNGIWIGSTGSFRPEMPGKTPRLVTLKHLGLGRVECATDVHVRRKGGPFDGRPIGVEMGSSCGATPRRRGVVHSSWPHQHSRWNR